MAEGWRRGLEPALAGLAPLEELAVSSYGPLGRAKLLTNAHGGAATLSSVSHRLVAAAGSRPAAAKVLLELLSTRQARGADCGLFSIIFATALIRATASLPPRVITALLPEALAECMVHLRSGRCAAVAPIRVSSLPCLLALVHTVISPKQVAVGSALPGELRHVCLLIVQAFVQSIGAGGPDSAPSARPPASPPTPSPVLMAQRLFPGVRLLPLAGRSLGSSELLEGVVLDVPLPAPLEAQHSARPLVVALYDVSLIAHEAGIGEAVDVAAADSEDTDSYDCAAAADLFQKFADALARRRVGLLACQKIIPTRLQDELARRGILALPRLSLRHIGAVRRLSGATPVSSLMAPPDGALGYVGGLVNLHLSGKEYLHMLPYEGDTITLAGVDGSGKLTFDDSSPERGMQPIKTGQPVVTLVLFSPSHAATEELEVVVSTALNTLRALLVGAPPRLVAGGGCVEVLLAQHLRTLAASLVSVPPLTGSEGNDAQTNATWESLAEDERRVMVEEGVRQRRQVYTFFAEALESVAVALACGIGPSRIRADEVLDLLRSANAPAVDLAERGKEGSRALWGWDVMCGAPCEVLRVEAAACTGSSSDSNSEGDSPSGGSFPGLRLTVDSALVVDLESSKLQAISDAMELASALVGIDAVIIDTR